jgi:T-complex protein 1 subunit epsilon
VTKIKSEMHADSSKRLGIDALWQGTNDMRELGVFESLASKVQQLQLATQVVRMILKIDDVFTPNEYE